MYRSIPALAAALLLAGALAACSNDVPTSKPTKHAGATSAPSAAAAKPKKLADVYTDKLAAVSDGSVAACQSPSSTECASDVGAIMTVVGDVQKDIDAHGGASAYPQSTQQIAKMRAAQQEYKDNGCEGDPTADDPNSDCWGVSAVTVGATTLTMTLGIDDPS
ncbi:hypothetical protein ACVB8X_14035 [Streptomyces sp. NRAIS4]